MLHVMCLESELDVDTFSILCMYVRMYVCMYVWMYVCVQTYISHTDIHTYTHTVNQWLPVTPTVKTNAYFQPNKPTDGIQARAWRMTLDVPLCLSSAAARHPRVLHEQCAAAAAQRRKPRRTGQGPRRARRCGWPSWGDHHPACMPCVCVCVYI